MSPRELQDVRGGSPIKPVWAWLPHSPDPVPCGSLALEAGIGRFEYDRSYAARPGAVALDPMHLPLSRWCLPIAEERNGGLFGVFRDLLPGGFAKELLERRRGVLLADPFAELELAGGDMPGAIAVCQDIEAKAAYRPPTSDDLFDRLRRLPEGEPAGRAVYELEGLSSLTLGRHRPRLTVLHEGQHWLAKLQDSPRRRQRVLGEFVAMRIAAKLGLHVADVRLYQCGEHEVLLVRRFDREIDTGGRVSRRFYLSANTVLGLGPRSPNKTHPMSYVVLGEALERFASSSARLRSLRREMWRRMAYNVLCGNTDDHPFNHGLLFQEGAWRLAPAFDIHPSRSHRGRQAMALTQDGSFVGSRANLLASCQAFAWLQSEAADFIEHSRQMLVENWPAEIEDETGLNLQVYPLGDPAAWLDSPAGHTG